MANKLNFSSNKVELFAIQAISHSYNSIYSNFHWNDKADDFDFVYSDLGVALEVSTILTSNTEKVLIYENSPHPNMNSIKQAKLDSNGNLLSYYGGNCIELKNLILKRITKKNIKAKKHLRKEISKCELCLCVDDGGWFEHIEEFDFLQKNVAMENLIFGKIFIITSKLFLVYENNKIVEYQRKI